MLLREDGRASSNAANQRQGQLHEALQRQAKLLAAAFIDGAKRVALQADAARRALQKLDSAFAMQGLQMLLSGIGRFETKLGGDFGAGRRRAGFLNRGLNERQNLLLAGGQFGAVEHGKLLLGMG